MHGLNRRKAHLKFGQPNEIDCYLGGPMLKKGSMIAATKTEKCPAQVSENELYLLITQNK